MGNGLMTERIDAGRYKWTVVFMLWFICFFNYADRQAIYAIFPRLESEFGFSKQQLGWIGSAFMWVYALAAPLAGWMADRFQRRPLILWGCIAWSLVTVATAWCTQVWHFITVRALEGLGESLYFPASMSLLSDYHSGESRSRAMGFHQSSVYFGTILGSWIGALIADYFGWRWSFILYGVSGALLAVVLFKGLREPQRTLAPTQTKRTSLAECFALPGVALVMLAFASANAVTTMFMTWAPTFLVQKFHFKLAAAGLSGTVFIYGASVVGTVTGGWLADRIAKRWAGGRLLMQGAALLVGAGFVYGVAHASTVGILVGLMMMFGLAKGVYDSCIFAGLFDLVPPDRRAGMAGWMNTVGWVGGGIGPVWVGWMASSGTASGELDRMSTALGYGSFCYILSAFLLWRAARSVVAQHSRF
jgi:MFS family permease